MKQNRSIKLALLDFDGTLVNKDILDLLCRVMNKEKESEELNKKFVRGELPGLSALITRINFLKGMTQQQINNVLETNDFLIPGTRELFEYFKKHNIITILASGNIIPVLKFYQQILGIDYIVGSQPQMHGNAIQGISESDYPKDKSFKIIGIKSILAKYDFSKYEIMAMGDSPSDKGMFEMSGLKIAINPKGDIADSADYIVENNLREVVDILG